MRQAVIAIFWNGSPLVAVTGPNTVHNVNIPKFLDWYADEYAFERDKLTAVYLDNVIECPKVDEVLRHVPKDTP